MIVCVCARVSDRDIRQALAAGNHTVKAVCQATGACNQCKTCAASIRVECDAFRTQPDDAPAA